jgi:(E)-4-hydroxy-3-methylbut-2-enyl-diphosphate synthase
MIRRKTRSVFVGSIGIGSEFPVRVQSMCSTDTKNVRSTLTQIRFLVKSGCEIIRLAVPDMEAAKSFRKIKKSCPVPLVADIHFDHRIVSEVIEHADKIRINPGNVSIEKIREIIKIITIHKKPVRIGVNSGSIPHNMEKKYGRSPLALAESSLYFSSIFEDAGIRDLILSAKASESGMTVEANRIIASRTDAPLHLGVTEAGTLVSGLAKSYICLSDLLRSGIGDTIRISLAENPVIEVKAAFELLHALGIRMKTHELIACPSCARAHFDVHKTARLVEKAISSFNIRNLQTIPYRKTLKIAVMGCEVNGPGEVADADCGIFGSKQGVALYIKGKKKGRKVPLKEGIRQLIAALRNLQGQFMN